MKTIDVLKAARAKLAQPGAWTRGAFARDRSGQCTSATGSAAVCWCAIGAVRSVFTSTFEARLELASVVSDEWDNYEDLPVAVVNDMATRVEPVLEMFDKAIAKLESEP